MARGNGTVGIAVFAGAEARATQAHLAELCARVFEQFDPAYLADRLPFVADPVLHLAQGEDGAPLGFKLGYRRGPALLYSWLGGVVSAVRGQRIAERLMQAQHDWAIGQGYRDVETRTRAANNRMIIVNLRAGFHIVGLETDTAGHAVVIQRRALPDKPDRA